MGKKISGKTGFEDKKHWCRIAFEKYFDENVTKIQFAKVRAIRKKMKLAYRSQKGVIKTKTLKKVKKTVAKKIAEKKKKIRAIKKIKALIKSKGNSKKALKKIKK